MEKVNSKIEVSNPLIAARQQQLKQASEHALELVATYNQIHFINDSISVTSKQTRASIESIEQPIILITGGDDTETVFLDYNGIELKYLKAVFYLGSKLGKVVRQFLKQDIIFVTVKDVDEALSLSGKYTNEGDVVLFSPACSSHEAFDNYKNRGNRFKASVDKYIQEIKK
jgi:UDP-N-acetylmuramoylalanine--D-glutamate ligase